MRKTPPTTRERKNRVRDDIEKTHATVVARYATKNDHSKYALPVPPPPPIILPIPHITVV